MKRARGGGEGKSLVPQHTRLALSFACLSFPPIIVHNSLPSLLPAVITLLSPFWGFQVVCSRNAQSFTNHSHFQWDCLGQSLPWRLYSSRIIVYSVERMSPDAKLKRWRSDGFCSGVRSYSQYDWYCVYPEIRWKSLVCWSTLPPTILECINHDHEWSSLLTQGPALIRPRLCKSNRRGL